MSLQWAIRVFRVEVDLQGAPGFGPDLSLKDEEWEPFAVVQQGTRTDTETGEEFRRVDVWCKSRVSR